jgi:predicted secreted protein
MKIMDVVNFIFVYILVWWVVIYAALPFGNEPPERKDMEPGQASSAPANPRLKMKFIWTSIIAFVLTGAIFATLHYTGFTLFGPQKPWPQE